jgi:hypothetical protein
MNKTYRIYRIEIVSDERVKFEKRDGENRVLEEKPPKALKYKEKNEEIDDLVKSASNRTLTEASEVRLLGETLFDILFASDADIQNFVSFYKEAVDAKQFLRVELDIDEEIVPDLAALPWEFMCLPARFNQQEIWFGTDPNIVFSRHRALWVSPEPILLTKDEPLKIALVVASPSNLPKFNYQPVKDALNELLSQDGLNVKLLDIIEQADRTAIDEVLEQEPHIFHFIGHGQFKKNVGQIALVDHESGKADWIDGATFSGLFAKYQPRIVLLQACEGAAGDSAQAFASVSSKVVQMNIPVVLAMQYLVPILVANQFTSCFYQQIARGYPVDIAAQLGRLAIALEPPYYESRDFATPVVFMRGQDGYLFPRADIKAEPVTPEKVMSIVAKIKTGAVLGGRLIGNEIGEINREANVVAELDLKKVKDAEVIANKIGTIGASGGTVQANLELGEVENTDTTGTKITSL